MDPCTASGDDSPGGIAWSLYLTFRDADPDIVTVGLGCDAAGGMTIHVFHRAPAAESGLPSRWRGYPVVMRLWEPEPEPSCTLAQVVASFPPIERPRRRRTPSSLIGIGRHLVQQLTPEFAGAPS